MIVLHSLDTYLWKCPCATLGRGCSGAGGVQGNPNPRCPSGRNTKWARPSLTQEVVPDPCTYDTTHLVRPPPPPICSQNSNHDKCWDWTKIPKAPKQSDPSWRCPWTGRSSTRAECGHHRWQCFPGWSGGQSRHALYTDAERGWWRGRRCWCCCSRQEFSLRTEHGAPGGAAGANKLQPRHWARHDTQPWCSIGIQCSGAWRSSVWGCHRGTQHSPRWTGLYPNNPTNPHPCRLSAQRWRQSIAGGGWSPGSLTYSARRTSLRRGEGLEDHACWGNLARVPWASSYGPKLLDMTGSLQRHMARGPYTPYQEVTLPLQAEEMGPAI
jgi:hypothetical protein